MDLNSEETKDFIRRYKEVVLETPLGEIHVCGDRAFYEELTREEKLTFSPSEITLLSKAAEIGSLSTVHQGETVHSGGKIKRSRARRLNQKTQVKPLDNSHRASEG